MHFSRHNDNNGSLPDPIQGGQVSLASVLTWCIREMRLNKLDNINGGELSFNLKLDGRPFWGTNFVYWDPFHTGPDPYGHDINLKSFKTSMTLKFVIILQNLIKAYHRKVVGVNITVNWPN